MINLYRSEDDMRIGIISAEDLSFLISRLEKEDSEDTDYTINRDTIDFLKSEGASKALITLLERALGDRAGIEVYYLSENLAGSPEADEEPDWQ